MKITHLKTNHVSNPLGFAIDNPIFSWIVEDTSDTVQIAARVQVSLDSEFEDIVFDSGKVNGSAIDNIAYTPPIELRPYQRYFWKVEIWGETETAESEIAWFETAKMDDTWQASWITPAWDNNQIHPTLLKEFDIANEIKSARAYICGLGLYHFELNAEKVGDEYLTPYCNAYDQWMQYQTFDITENIKLGFNRIEIMLGNGWYKGRYGSGGGVAEYYGNRFALLCEIRIKLANGDEIVINSDTSWQAQKSPVVASDIFDGEVYDARIGKNKLSDDELSAVKTIDIEVPLLEARRSLPVRVMDILKPIAVLHTPAGETVLDMGQNITGWLRFKTNAPAGTEIKLQFGELLQEGNFFRENLRTAKAEYIYIADGTTATTEPYFTFFGFRYVKITGWVGDINLEDFTGCVVYSDMDTIGEIETSNDKINRLIKNTFWSQIDNFLDIPMDCPQRDERLGWTGDIQVFSGTASFNMDVMAFLSKFAYDLEKEQSKLGGMVPHIVPRANQQDGAAAAWADVATILPWTLYEFYGDIGVLEQQFNSMRAWVDYVKSIDDSSGSKRLWTGGKHFGDWLSLDEPLYPDVRRGGTPHDFIASAYYCYSSRLVAQTAKVLEKHEISETYERLSQEIKSAIQQEYFTGDGQFILSTQTGYLLAIFMDLAPTGYGKQLESDFITQIKKDGVYLRTGFVGTPLLCRVLSNIGANDLAYQLLLNEDNPSWLYAVNLGATTIWERWNALNPDGLISSKNMRSHSFNHYAYGSVVEWLYRDVCGLNPTADVNESVGFRHALITPKPHPSIQSARARYRSVAGYYQSAWQIDEAGYVNLEISIPFNASAEIILSDVNLSDVTLDGENLTDASQIATNVSFNLNAGTYRITYPLSENKLFES